MYDPHPSWPPKRVVVATDFSAAADAALVVGEALAERTGAALHLLHVMADRAPVISAKGLEVNAASLVEKEVEGHVRVGNPKTHIDSFRCEMTSQIVLLGAAGLHGLRRHILGSVADHEIRVPGCPLLLVNRRPLDGEFKRILVAVELPDVRTPALEMAVRAAHDLRGELVLLHVPPPRGYSSDSRHVELHPETAAERLRATAASIDPTIPAQAIARRGDVAQCVRAAAQEFDAQLVVMGAERNPDGWPGDIVDQVVRSGLDAVLLVWPDAGP